ncbi:MULTISPECIES: ComEC/Rec2 family competence protein [Clostridium]|uniref:ComEC/Rec2 family competence protein n=1 Tax=Clostridium TaxID=1485 RepID=UPI0009C19406|nr:MULTISPECIES: ComEC/Rec2 family competence protein [Clostridium]PJI07095.1 hypothetical protein CUB90_04110 [Clostridium sp. CT7]
MKRPLVFYFVSIILGILTAAFLKNYILIGAVMAASFFVIMFFTNRKYFFFINLCFFIIGFVACVQYFNLSIQSGKLVSVRVNGKSGYYLTGSYKGRNINIYGKNINVKLGEIIRIKGTYEKSMDYGSGTIGTLHIDKVQSYKSDIVTEMYDIRSEIYENYCSHMSKNRSGIIMSLCFGDTSNLSGDDKNELKKLGIIHAVSVSGMHLAVIYGLLEKTIGLISAIVVSLFYVIFTGCLPATMRAFIMIFILKLSVKVYKNYDSLSSIALSGILMLIFKPYYIFNIGAVLSYLATIGILLYYKKISRALYKLPQKLNESISLTLSAQVFSVPYAGIVLKTFSGGFILGNLIIVPIYSVVIILGNLGGLTYKIEPVFNILCYFLNILLKSCDGLIKVALKATPPMMYMSEFTSISLTVMIFSFMLTIKGYRKFKYLPILLSLGIIINTYHYFPEINCVNINNKNAIIVRYRDSADLITNYMIKKKSQKENMLSSLGVNRIITVKNNKLLRINRSMYEIFWENGAKIYFKNREIAYISGDSIYYKGFYLHHYGIIKFGNYSKYSFLGVKASIKVINGKVLVFKGWEK